MKPLPIPNLEQLFGVFGGLSRLTKTYQRTYELTQASARDLVLAEIGERIARSVRNEDVTESYRLDSQEELVLALLWAQLNYPEGI